MGMERNQYNYLALFTDEKKIVAMGDRAEDIQARNPVVWEKDSERIAVVPIYDPNNFESSYLEAAILFFVHAFRHEKYRFLSNLLAGNRLRPVLHLQLNGYEKLPTDQRELVEYSLLRNKAFNTNRLLINGIPIKDVSPALDQALRRYKW